MSTKNSGRARWMSAGIILAVISATGVSASAAATGTEAKLVGQAACAGCHAEKVEAFAQTFHGRKALSNPKLANGCESCHGPASLHVDGGGDKTKIINPKKLAASDLAETCLACHKDKALMMWKTGAHSQHNVSCLSCHSIHEGEGRPSLVNGKTETCLKCHKKQKADMRLASHHPVLEGKMSCVSCHNPHGGIEGNLKADSGEELCAKCHAEKVGPFAFEHPPVSDGCHNCHLPHGSPVDRLLKQSLPYLCLNCHRFPHTTGGPPAAPSIAIAELRGSCVLCHKEIHGSDRKTSFKD